MIDREERDSVVGSPRVSDVEVCSGDERSAFLTRRSVGVFADDYSTEDCSCCVHQHQHHHHHHHYHQQQQQQKVPFVETMRCRHVAKATTALRVVVLRASLVVLFVVGAAFAVTSAIDFRVFDVSEEITKDNGWLLPSPKHVIARRRLRRSILSSSELLHDEPPESSDGGNGSDGNGDSAVASTVKSKTSKLLSSSSPLRRVQVDDVRRILSEFSNCQRVSTIRANATYLTSGWTKAVYVGDGHTVDDDRLGTDPLRGRRLRRQVAIKTVDELGRDVRQCIRRRQDEATADRLESSDEVSTVDARRTATCQRHVEQKLLKEAYVLRVLDNEHIVKLMDLCIPPPEGVGDDSGRFGRGNKLSFVTMVTELGTGVDIIRLLQMTWEERLKITYDLTRLLHYLADTSFGSVALNDFRRQQFVLVDTVDVDPFVQLKLVDVDDIGFDETSCLTDDDCVQVFQPPENITIRVPCYRQRCEGMNEMRNIANAGRHFVAFLLAPGTPLALRSLVDRIVVGYSGATLRIDELLELVEQVVRSYSDGSYLARDTSSSAADDSMTLRYAALPGNDLPGLHDYRCRFSIARSGCTVTVHDRFEAEQLCDFDPDCRAFVITNRTSWTGRKFVHLKNGVSSPTLNRETSLFVRPL